mmetsp:Transcript_18571/g.28527  ORF Transcript_18571/g.28527 Transcript_18571/m.28527 type:complete len:117 (+) Transcript_18571:593-943(+)
MLWKKKRPSASQKLKKIHHRFNSNPRPLRNLQISTNHTFTSDFHRGSNQLASNSSEEGSARKGSIEKIGELSSLTHEMTPFTQTNRAPMRSTNSTNMKETTNADSSMAHHTTTGFY